MVAMRVRGVAPYDVNDAEEVLVPWPKNHKARTRADIVRAAAAAFRARGLAGVRLDELMASTGRTHGGFYAHFSSKEDLLAAALELASQQTIDALSRTLEALPAAHRLQAVIDTYLSLEGTRYYWRKRDRDQDTGSSASTLGPQGNALQGEPQVLAH